MQQRLDQLNVRAPSQGLHDITSPVRQWLSEAGVSTGLLTLFCRHTSASLILTENASPDVRVDMEAAFERLAPETEGLYAHDDEGPDDMPAHIRTAMTGVNLSIPLIAGRLALGTWQGVFLFEHRRNTPERLIALHLVGE